MTQKSKPHRGLTAAQAEALASRNAGKPTGKVVEPGAKPGDEIKAELDDLLDEIDGVLEENAEDFVRSYVQKGGQ